MAAATAHFRDGEACVPYFLLAKTAFQQPFTKPPGMQPIPATFGGDKTFSMSPRHFETLKKLPSAITRRRWNEWKKRSNTGSRKHDVRNSFAPLDYLSQQRAGSKRTHQFAYECSKSNASIAEKNKSFVFNAVTTLSRFAELCRPIGCVRLTRIASVVLAAVSIWCPVPVLAQDLDYMVYTESPRLFLRERRLRLLKRERERQSMRWVQFETLIAGKARMSEPGFAYALYGIVSGETEPCKAAADWAVQTANANNPDDLRQIALVADWCQTSLSEAQSTQITRKLTPSLSTRPKAPQAIRSTALAAFAVADSEPRAAAAFLQYAVEDWWRKQVQPQLRDGKNPFERKADLMAVVEFLHAVRDNLRADLREGSVKWFENLAPMLVLSYYPAPWPSAENEYRIPMYEGSGEPNLKEAALGRASELALVALTPTPNPTSSSRAG